MEQLYGEVAQRVGGDKELVIASANTSTLTLPTLYENIFTSYAKKNIFFKTSKVTELPIKSNYTYAYLPDPQPMVTPGYQLVYDAESGGYVERAPSEASD